MCSHIGAIQNIITLGSVLLRLFQWQMASMLSSSRILAVVFVCMSLCRSSSPLPKKAKKYSTIRCMKCNNVKHQKEITRFFFLFKVWIFWQKSFGASCNLYGSKISIDCITQCLKILEKVSFNIASEASYVYILSGQKFIKNAENGPFWRLFDNLKLVVKQCYQTCHF